MKNKSDENIKSAKTDRSSTENMDKILFKISNAADTALDLNELYQKIHRLLSTLFDTTNFYIALHNANYGTTRFVYFVDEKMPGTPGQGFAFHLSKGSLTRIAIESGEPQIIRKEELLKYCHDNNFEPIRPVSEIWVGVPIKIKNRVIGVMAVQSYTDPNRFNEKDMEFLNSVSVQVAKAIKRIKSLEQSWMYDNRHQNILDNIKDAIYSADYLGIISYVSPAIEPITGYRPGELSGIFRWYSKAKEKMWSTVLVHPDDRARVEELIKNSIEHMMPFEIEYRIIKKDGKTNWISEKGRFSKGNQGDIRLNGIITDIQEKKQAEQINKALFSISNAVNTTFDLNELYKKIHESLGYVINVENFYIALYDKNKDTISFTFDTDKFDGHIVEVIEASKSTSLTAQVIRTGRPLLLTKEEQFQQVRSLGGEILGIPSELWLGVPLKVKNEVIGAMVTQSYTDSSQYGEKEAAILGAVSDQVAIAIERKQYVEQLKIRETLITALYNISNAILTASNIEQLCESIHESLKKVIALDNFSLALYDQQADLLSFPYRRDEHELADKIENASQTSSLTFEVIRRGRAIYLRDEQEQLELVKRLGGKSIGFLSKSWFGVPLKSKNNILGAIITQNYATQNFYKKSDIDLLTSVSEQIAFAIEHKIGETELAAAQKQLIEKAHQAGMADIATGTLHNVGNLLNSVNTSAFVISDTLRKPFVDKYQQANNVLRQQMDNVEEFISSDPKGRKLLEYYLILEDDFVEERQIILHHLDRLNRKIKNISDVMAAQQAYAGSSILSEDHPLSEIVEDALIMMDEMLESHAITVTTDYKKTPIIRLQKTKLIHIVIDLIKNAKDSLVEKNKTNKRLNLTIDSNQSGVFLVISDNGIGIPQKDLKKIFSHGFTTKEGGYGFGLHSCANHMTEMGGKMWAESDGPGTGAAFVLEFPALKF